MRVHSSRVTGVLSCCVSSTLDHRPPARTLHVAFIFVNCSCGVIAVVGFVDLRQALFPPKQFLSLTAAQVEDRRRALEKYIQDVSVLGKKWVQMLVIPPHAHHRPVHMLCVGGGLHARITH